LCEFYFILSFQDIDIPSGFQNSKWTFIKYLWDSVHLVEETHESYCSLDSFLEWLNQKTSSLSRQRSLNKNQLQEVLLRVSLYLRDIELACFTDHDGTPVPDYLINSKMASSNVYSTNRVLQLLSDTIHYGSGYVPYKLGHINTNKKKEAPNSLSKKTNQLGLAKKRAPKSSKKV